MRNARFFLVLMVALAAAGCARKTAQTYYIMDPQTGQPVPVITQQQQMAQAWPAYAQQGYTPTPYGQGAYAQPSYAPQAAQAYAAPAQPRGASTGRGLFNSRSRRATVTYAQPQPAVQQPYVAQYTPP